VAISSGDASIFPDALLAKHRHACKKACPVAGSCPGDCSQKSEAERAACWEKCEKSFVLSGCPRSFCKCCVVIGQLD
jgi:hypothetical protein